MSIRQNFPTTPPSLVLDFANSKTLDPRITFSRTTTATRMNELGLIETVDADVARFDHKYENGVIKSLGLLVEESRSNLVTYSEDFSQWTLPSSITITPNNIVSPDGTQNADLVSTTVNESGPSVSITASQNTTYTLSVFLKYGNTPTIRLRDFDGGTNPGHHVIFNLLTQTFSSALNLDDYGYIPYPNGWYRVWMTFTTGSYTNLSLQVRSASEVSGDETFYAWGGQIEPGPSPTSYIPRPDTSTATRNPDTVTMTGNNFSNWYNPSEGTVFVDSLVKYNPEATKFVWSLYGGSIDHSLRQPHLTGLRFRAVIGGAFTPAPGTGFNATNGSTTKAAVAYDSTTGRLQVGTSGDDVTMIGTADPTIFKIGPHNGTISKLTYYPTRLTNAQLQTLTK